jgi:hypothetical protein
MNAPTFHRFLLEEKKKGAKNPVAPFFNARPVEMKTLVDYSWDLIRKNPLTDTFDDDTPFEDVSLYRYKDSGEDVMSDLCVVDTHGADEVEITVNEANRKRTKA